MPRQVDHESRRRRIAEAVCLLADEHGLEGVTLRDVATRAEVSMGAVQRCFRSKEEMLLFALAHVGERITERVRARLGDDRAAPAGGELEHAVTEVALLGEEHRAEARVWLAFVAQAAVSPPLAATLKANYAALQGMFARLIGAAAGNTRRDPEREARTLLALADGLTTHVLIGHLTAQQAQDVLRAHLDGIRGRPADAATAARGCETLDSGANHGGADHVIEATP